jgi:hypothetical protein
MGMVAGRATTGKADTVNIVDHAAVSIWGRGSKTNRPKAKSSMMTLPRPK